MDHLTTARTEPERGSISSPTTTAPSPTARRLAVASISPNTRESYRRALRQFDTWRGCRPLDDSTLAAYLAVLYDSGRSPSVAAMAVAVVRFVPALPTTRTRPETRPAASSQASGAPPPIAAEAGPTPLPPTTFRPSLPRATGREHPGAASRLRPSPPGAADWTP